MTKSISTIRLAGEDRGNHAAELQLLTHLLDACLRERHFIYKTPKFDDLSVMDDTGYAYEHDELRVALHFERGLCLQVSQFWRRNEQHDSASLLEMAMEIADGIAKLHEQAHDIRVMMAEVRAAAKREVAKGVRRGLRYKLVSVEPTPYRIWRSTKVVAEVRVESLGRSLQPQIAIFSAEYGDQLKQIFAEEFDVQARRAHRRAELDRIGATGVIDAVVVNALRGRGADLGSVLGQLGAMESAQLDLNVDGVNHRLHWKEGTVFASVDLGDGATWHEGTLNLDEAPIALGKRVQGKPLVNVFMHPFLSGRLLVEASNGKKGEWASLRCRPELLYFNSQTGMLWPSDQ